MTNIVTLDFLHFREDLKLHYSRYIRVQEKRNKLHFRRLVANRENYGIMQTKSYSRSNED